MAKISDSSIQFTLCPIYTLNAIMSKQLSPHSHNMHTANVAVQRIHKAGRFQHTTGHPLADRHSCSGRHTGVFTDHPQPSLWCVLCVRCAMCAMCEVCYV